jgi:hypothetical protein
MHNWMANYRYRSIGRDLRNKYSILTTITSTAILTTCHGSGTGILTLIVEFAFHDYPSYVKTCKYNYNLY